MCKVYVWMCSVISRNVVNVSVPCGHIRKIPPTYYVYIHTTYAYAVRCKLNEEKNRFSAQCSHGYVINLLISFAVEHK